MEQSAQASNDRTNRRKLIWGLIALIGPTALIILALVLYAVSNFVFSTVTTPETQECAVNSISGACATDAELFESSNSGNAVVNVILFLIGVVSILTWLPGIIVGIILLATRKKLPYANNQP